jgi:ATP-dependent Clp protease adaptor protein ClpS
MSTETNVVEKVQEVIEVKEPSMYKVLLHNDDRTTFEFVIQVLITVFHRNLEEAIELTRDIHLQGQGIAGSPYTKEIAEEKISETTLLARANGFPLISTYEEL